MINVVLEDLKGFAPLNDYVSGRIYRGNIPSNPSYPLVFFEADQEVQNTLSGPSSLQKYNFTFEVLAKTYSLTKSIVTEIQNALDTATEYKRTTLSIDDGKYIDELDRYSITCEVSIWGV